MSTHVQRADTEEEKGELTGRSCHKDSPQFPVAHDGHNHQHVAQDGGQYDETNNETLDED